MKLDYEYIKKILTIMENYPKHEIESHEFWKLTGLTQDGKTYDDEILDKFIGHMKLIADDYLIESSLENFGIEFNRGNLFTSTAHYRITSRGYEFLDVLKNDTAFNKIKKFALSNALEIGKKVLVEVSSKMITGGI